MILSLSATNTSTNLGSILVSLKLVKLANTPGIMANNKHNPATIPPPYFRPFIKSFLLILLFNKSFKPINANKGNKA